ncbi:MAG: ABC transporter substrate-binding protein, partial [Solirubrobacteraceae bacterium]
MAIAGGGADRLDIDHRSARRWRFGMADVLPLSRRSVIAGVGAAVVSGAPAVAAAPGARIRKLVLLCAAQSSDPQEFQAAQLVAAAWRQLGLDIVVRPLPRPQLASLVWDQRTKWDLTMWEMVGRPERSDPDELVYSLFDSATANGGYDFVNYINPAYDRVAQAQRVELDPKKRQALIWQAQDIINHDQPYTFLVYPKNTIGYSSKVWKSSSLVDQSGVGIRCFWTYVHAEPQGEQKDMLLNGAQALVALNPLYIGGAIDSWVTEIVWDRLLRVGPDGLPRPWSASATKWVDPTTLDVDIRPGQVWHDSQPLTVDDVVYSFEVPAMGNMSPMYKPFVSNIADVRQTGPWQVQFKLKSPNAGFLTTCLAKLNVIPKHVWAPIIADLKAKGQNAETYQETKPIGSGPFRFVSFNLQDRVVLEAFPKHWQPPKMHRWIMRIVTNTDAALGMLSRGEINFLSDYRGDPKLLAAMAAKTSGIAVTSTTDLGFRYVALNERRPPFHDAGLRRALSLAINRELIAAAAFNGYA